MSLLRLLRPNRLGIALFALLLVVHVGLVHWFGRVTHRGDRTEARIGYGKLVIAQSVTEEAEPLGTRRELSATVHWHWLLLLVAATFVVASLAGHGIARLVPASRGKHPIARVFGWVLGMPLLVAFLLSGWWSKSYWGYPLFRPGVDSRIVSADRVASLTPVSTLIDEDGTHSFVIDPEYYIPKTGDFGRGGYYALELRAVYALQDRGKLPGPIQLLGAEAERRPDEYFGAHRWRLPEPIRQMSPDEVAPLHALAVSTGLPHDGCWGGGRRLAGIVIEAEGKRGENLLFMAFAGRNVDNDHFPYYELLFSRPKAGGEPRLLSGRRFHFDNCGIEGCEWYVIFGILSLAGLGAALVVALVVFIAGHTRRAHTDLVPSHQAAEKPRVPRAPRG